MSDVNGTHRRLVEAQFQSAKEDGLRQQFIGRVANAHAVSLRVLCGNNAADAVQVCIELAASFAAGHNMPLPVLQAAIALSYEGAAAEIKAMRATKPEGVVKAV